MMFELLIIFRLSKELIVYGIFDIGTIYYGQYLFLFIITVLNIRVFNFKLEL